MLDNNEYSIVAIDDENIARLSVKLIAEQFALNNSFSAFNGDTAEDLFDRWLWPLMIDVLNEKLSFCVRHDPTNEIVAAIIANDLYLDDKQHPFQSSAPPASSFAADLCDEMRDRFVREDFHQLLTPNLVLSISAGATRSSHSGKGIASQLRTDVCRYAREQRGFQYAFVQTTSAATRHIYLKKMNGEEKTLLNPADWCWKKKDRDHRIYPMQNYRGEPIVNILVKLI